MTRFPFFHALSCSLLALASQALGWQPSGESVPAAPQEFRAAWISTVHNIDWPSRSGLSGAAQRAELLTILNTCAQLKLNAVFLQVRPNADALYQSSLEPWSQWLSGPGVNPGYDPLAFAIQEAHRRGIELHAWFNPFRAKANVKHAVGRNHISLTRPDLMKRNGSVLLMNPSASASRDHAMRVILDVVRRYDIDGVHLDDYFYPYPTPGRTWSPASFSDGKSPSQRRACIDDFVHDCTNPSNPPNPGCAWASARSASGVRAFPAALKREWTLTSTWPATPASGFPADGWITWPRSFTGAAARPSRAFRS